MEDIHEQKRFLVSADVGSLFFIIRQFYIKKLLTSEYLMIVRDPNLCYVVQCKFVEIFNGLLLPANIRQQRF